MKAKFTDEQVLNLFDSTPSAPSQLKQFAIAEIAPGAKIHVSFSDGTDYYCLVSSNTINLFCNDQYYGLAHIMCDYAGPHLNTYLIKAEAIVLSGSPDNSLFPIGKTPDAISKNEWSYLPRLREHFVDKYSSLLRSMPESFEANYGKLIMTMGDHELRIIDGQLSFVEADA